MVSSIPSIDKGMLETVGKIKKKEEKGEVGGCVKIYGRCVCIT